MPMVIWSFIKSNWQALALVVILAVGAAWLQRQQADFTKTITELNSSHQVEIEKINKARLQEAKEHEVQLKQLQDSINKIQADYASAQDALRKQQAADTRQIVKKYGNDADGLATLLAERLGFVVVK